MATAEAIVLPVRQTEITSRVVFTEGDPSPSWWRPNDIAATMAARISWREPLMDARVTMGAFFRLQTASPRRQRGRQHARLLC